jgi:ABC-2 type transport system ATP-binding protein
VIYTGKMPRVGWYLCLERGHNVGVKPVVELKNLSKTIGKKKIIDNLNLSLYPGQITGFLGPNGAGKTTTIRMMVGLMKPSEGDVLIEGKSLREDFEGSISKVGVIVENPEMYKFMSGYKNLLHFARMHDGVTKARIDEVIAQVGMQNRIHEKVSKYSLGMRQRLGLAQALLHRPKFLILDEPTNGLDPAGIREFRMYLRKIADEEGVSVFVSSHMLSEIELMCDRIAIIQNGKLVDVEETADTEKSHYYIEALPLSAVENILVAEGFAVELINDGFIIEAEKEQIPMLMKKLATEEIQLFAVNPYRKTLEDQFLEITGGGQIAEAHTK